MGSSKPGPNPLSMSGQALRWKKKILIRILRETLIVGESAVELDSVVDGSGMNLLGIGFYQPVIGKWLHRGRFGPTYRAGFYHT